MTTADAVLEAMRGYLGVAEDPPKSNRTIIGEKFGWNGVPWCAETVTVCQHEAGNTEFQGSASCSVLVARYEDGTNGSWLGNPGADLLLPGDEFFLGSRGQDHTGLVESIDGNTVRTVEGNWGDKVARVTRPVTAFFGFGRPNYEAQGDDVQLEAKDPIVVDILGKLNKAVESLHNSVEPAVGRLDLARALADPDKLAAKIAAKIPVAEVTTDVVKAALKEALKEGTD